MANRARNAAFAATSVFVGVTIAACSSGSGAARVARPVAQAAAAPCGLVSRAEAQAILGTALRSPRVAPLGPTCIFESTDGAVLATMSIQPGTISQIQARVHDLSTATVQARTTYCGTLGQPMLWAPLNQSMMLVITAPCSVGEQMAAKALPRIS